MACKHCERDQCLIHCQADKDGEHCPDPSTIAYAGVEDICDVVCLNCGISGSFVFFPKEVDWE